MKHMTWKKQPVLRKHITWKKTTSFDETYEAKKGEKKVTSEAAYCILLKKRKYIFCRRSFFTTKHKILKSQKRQHLKQPVLMKHMTWKKQPVLRKHMTWKKQPVLRKHMRWKREKRSNIVRIDILSQFFSLHSIRCFLPSDDDVFHQKRQILGKTKICLEVDTLDCRICLIPVAGMLSISDNYLTPFSVFFTQICSQLNNQSKKCFFVQLWQMLLPHKQCC